MVFKFYLLFFIIKVRMKLRITDIAKMANVSTATVSHVLNEKIKGNMSEATYIKVKNIISENNYTTDRISSAMRTGKTRVIGLILPTNTNLYYAQLANSIESTLFKAGYLTYMCTTDYSIDTEKEYIKTLLQQKVSGIFLCSSGLSNEELAQLNENNPNTNIILLDEKIENYNGNKVIADDFAGGEIGTQYLFDNQHFRIAIVAGPKNLESTNNRLSGIKSKYESKGISFEDQILVYGDYLINRSRELILDLLKESRDFTAIFALNDMMAIGAILAINEEGLRVPEDISVLGYDNINLTELFYPKISTIEIPINQIAQKALDIILNPEENKTGSINPIKPRLIVRESVMYHY